LGLTLNIWLELFSDHKEKTKSETSTTAQLILRRSQAGVSIDTSLRVRAWEDLG
jgi:hypothetical protein